MPVFFHELFKGLGTSDLKSDDLKKILDSVTVHYNAKVAEEKKVHGGGKKGKQKPKIAAGKQTLDARNNNPQMVSDLMGEDDYGDYGDEGQTREQEGEYDFMWEPSGVWVCVTI